MREKLKNFKDYDDFLKNFENHREKNEARTHLMREEGFKELNDKYGSNQNVYDQAPEMFKDKYSAFREDCYDGHWDRKENKPYSPPQ